MSGPFACAGRLTGWGLCLARGFPLGAYALFDPTLVSGHPLLRGIPCCGGCLGPTFHWSDVSLGTAFPFAGPLDCSGHALGRAFCTPVGDMSAWPHVRAGRFSAPATPRGYRTINTILPRPKASSQMPDSAIAIQNAACHVRLGAGRARSCSEKRFDMPKLSPKTVNDRLRRMHRNGAEFLNPARTAPVLACRRHVDAASTSASAITALCGRA